MNLSISVSLIAAIIKHAPKFLASGGMLVKALKYMGMHAICIKAGRDEADLSYLMFSLLKDFSRA